jgi:hypothetical protein
VNLQQTQRAFDLLAKCIAHPGWGFNLMVPPETGDPAAAMLLWWRIAELAAQAGVVGIQLDRKTLTVRYKP